MADSGKKSSIGGKSTAHLVNIKRPSEVRKRLKLVFQRISARLKLKKNDEELAVALALMDISVSGAGFFTSRMLSKGTPVELCIMDPAPVTVKGTIIWCTPMNSGMNLLRYPFRAGVQFSFNSDEERRAFADYVSMLSKNHSIQVKEAAPAAPAAPATPAAAPAAEAPKSTVELSGNSPTAEAPTGEAPAAEGEKPAEAAAETPAATDDKDGEKKAA